MVTDKLEGLLFCVDEGSASVFAKNWAWLVPATQVPVVYTAFGDWILKPEGQRQCSVLDLLELELRPVEMSTAQLLRVLEEDETQRDMWLLEGTVQKLRRQGLALGAGEIYAYRVHPYLGAPVSTDNIKVERLEIFQSNLSSLMRSLAEL